MRGLSSTLTAHHPPPTTHHQPPTTNHQPPTTNRQLPTAYFLSSLSTQHSALSFSPPPTANRQPPTANRQLPTANRQLSFFTQHPALSTQHFLSPHCQPPTANCPLSFFTQHSAPSTQHFLSPHWPAKVQFGAMNDNGLASIKFAVWSPPRFGLPSRVSLRTPEPALKSIWLSLTHTRLGLKVSSKK